MDVAEWLNALGLGEYAEAFLANHIDAGTLAGLTAEDLKELGVTSVGHRRKILAAITRLDRHAPGSNDPVAPPPAADRRQVTILFVDLSGFSALSDELDAEDVRDIIGRFFEIADGIIAECGGTIDKHIGDAVMALFGAPVAHHDDPLRAARAALDIRAAMAELSAEFARPLVAHFGIASGEVVAGGIGRGERTEFTVLGGSVNLAARLVDLARPAEILISDTVQRLLGSRAECRPVGETGIKGFALPVKIWRLEGLASAAVPSTPFVGRRQELDRLAGILDACRGNGSGAVVHLRGEAGIGKSRLLAEFARLAGERGFACHTGLVLDFGVAKGTDAIRTLVRSLLGLTFTSSGTERRVAADAALADHLLPAERRPFLYDLLDLPQPVDMQVVYDAMDNAVRRIGKQDTAADLVRAAAQRGPVLIMIEDLHWAQPIVLGHMAAIAALTSHLPVILAGTTRSEGDPLGAAWRSQAGSVPVVTIELGPLTESDAVALSTAFPDLDRNMVSACVERAGGNPLFLEQLLRNAQESLDEDVPATIRSLVLARMDRLPGPDRHALQAAAVLGQRFEVHLLRHLISRPDYDAAELVSHGLVRPDGGGFLFAHALIRDSVYATMLKTQRRWLHQRVADWFGSRDPMLRAEHLDRAGDEGAAQAYLEAARAEQRNFRYERALALVRRGLELAGSRPVASPLRFLLGDLLLDMGDVPGGMAAFRQALDLARDDHERCCALYGLAAGMRISDDIVGALKTLDEAQELASANGLILELARIHHLRGNLYFPLGRIEGCLAEHRQALAYALQAGSRDTEARALGGIGDAEYARGRMITAGDCFRRCVALCNDHGFGRIAVSNLSMIAFTSLFEAKMDEALRSGLNAIDAAQRVGHQRAEIVSRHTVFCALYEMGEFDPAVAHIDRARDLVRQLGAWRFEPENLAFLAQIDLASGLREQARQRTREAVRLCRETGINYIGPIVLSIHARACSDPAERARALAEARAILDAGTLSHNHLWYYREAIDIGLESGDWDAVERLADAFTAYMGAEPLPFGTFVVARGRALAAFGRGRRDARHRAHIRRLRDDALGRRLVTLAAALSAALGE